MLTAAAFACGRPEAQPASAPPAAEPRRAPPAPKPRAIWPRFQELSAWQPVTEKPISSRGHAAGNWELEIRVSPESREAYRTLGPGSSLSDGSVIVASHRDVDRGTSGPLYVMEKKTGRWSFLVLDADGRTSEHGPLTLCVRCHAEAANDMLFGLPHAAQKREGSVLPATEPSKK